MSLDTERYRLHNTLKTLRLHWDEVQKVWNDPVRKEFEQRCWNVLEPSVIATLAAIDSLSQVLMQARQECR
jgi:hypothetical protein